MVDQRDQEERAREFLFAICHGLKKSLDLPAACIVVGRSAWLLDITFDGNLRRGLAGLVRLTDDGQVHTISLADVQLDSRATGFHYFDEYQRWVGVDSQLARALPQLPAANDTKPDLTKPFDAVVLSPKSTSASCRFLQCDEQFVLRAKRLKELASGVIAKIAPTKHTVRAGQTWVYGEILESRISVSELKLRPLRLSACGDWDPSEQEWGADGLLESWEVELVRSGRRPMFEMEAMGGDGMFLNIDDDPILQAVDLYEAGEKARATEILTGLLRKDLRRLDAHAHLGNFTFTRQVARARRHYEVGVRIGEQAAPPDRDIVLPWMIIENRPFLRCLVGYGLCLWRQRAWDEAEQVFRRLLRLNPNDNQGIRFLLPDVIRRKRWRSR